MVGAMVGGHGRGITLGGLMVGDHGWWHLVMRYIIKIRNEEKTTC